MENNKVLIICLTISIWAVIVAGTVIFATTFNNNSNANQNTVQGNNSTVASSGSANSGSSSSGSSSKSSSSGSSVKSSSSGSSSGSSSSDSSSSSGVRYRYCTTHGWIQTDSSNRCPYCIQEGLDSRTVKGSTRYA